MIAATSFLISERSFVNLHIYKKKCDFYAHWKEGKLSEQEVIAAYWFCGLYELTTKSRPLQRTSAGTPLWGLQVDLGYRTSLKNTIIHNKNESLYINIKYIIISAEL